MSRPRRLGSGFSPNEGPITVGAKNVSSFGSRHRSANAPTHSDPGRDQRATRRSAPSRSPTRRSTPDRRSTNRHSRADVNGRSSWNARRSWNMGGEGCRSDIEYARFRHLPRAHRGSCARAGSPVGDGAPSLSRVRPERSRFARARRAARSVARAARSSVATTSRRISRARGSRARRRRRARSQRA